MGTRELVNNLQRTAKSAERNSLEALSQIGNLADSFDQMKDQFIVVLKSANDTTKQLIENRDEELKLTCYELAKTFDTHANTLDEAKSLYAWVTDSEVEGKDETQD